MTASSEQPAVSGKKRMSRRIIGFVCLLLAVLLPTVSLQAQQPGKIFRIGFLERSTAAGSTVLLMAFRQELTKLGWIEGKNLFIESRFADQQVERLPDLAAELVRLKVDVIVSGGSGPTLSAKKATATIPIVMAQEPNPVGNGFVASLALPGGNVTGLASLQTDLGTKRLEIVSDAIPGLVRVAYLRAAGRGVAGDLPVKQLRAAALSLKLKLEEIDTQFDDKGLESAFQTAKTKQVGAVSTSGAPPFFAERKRIVELAAKYRLPAIYSDREFVDEGVLMSYGVDRADLYRRAAYYVDKILKGAKPADLPVQQATKFEFVINLKAAKQIGLTIPVRVLERANQVIK